MKSTDIMHTEQNIIMDKKLEEKSNKRQPYKIFLITLVIFNIILIIGICFLLYFLIYKIKSNNIENSIDKEELENKNSISATYSVQSGKKVQLFNPEKISIKDDDYIVETLESNNNLRNLRSITVDKGSYVPTESGYLSIKITFKIILNNLNEIFQNSKELIKVDLSNLEMKNVLSMNSTFSGCLNLDYINFEGVNSNSLLDMAYTFEKCNNLKNLNLSPIKTGNLRVVKGIFSDCDKLEIINITSFDKVDKSIFEGIKSKPNIIANENTSGAILNIFYNLFNINVNVTIIKYQNNSDKIRECMIGEKEKCKECNSMIPGNCLSCNEGYYLPFNEINNTKCLPCNIIENCLTCFGDKNYIVCSSCDSSFKLENNRCLKIKKEKCVIGENEKCKSCQDDEEFIDKCKTCNYGYYLSNNTNKTKCLSCNKIDKCIECNEDNDNLICKRCQDGYLLLNNSCIEEKCEIGINEKCSSCKTDIGRKKECNTCNEGYFISEANPLFCTKCSIDNCRYCSILNGKEVCNECLDTFSTIKDEFGLIKLCECPSEYNINNGLCIKPGNWIRILMDVDYSWNNGLATILYTGDTNIELNELDVYVNGTLVQVTKSSNRIEYKFNKGGIYVLELNIKIILTSMEWLFSYSDFIYSISFLPGFDSTKVTSMSYTFVNLNVESIDMKYLNLSSLKNLRSFIHENYYVKRLEKLNEYIIDLSSFDTSQITTCLRMFHNLHNDAIIKISNKFTKCKEQISFENKIINVDEIECKKKFENCKECNGSKETLKCSKCQIGYSLNNDNICVEQKCITGEKEKCLDCKIDEGKENECINCNEGYYLPINLNHHNICQKCQIEGCKTCDNSNGICKKCKDFYEPLINDGTIIECNLICDLGEGNKCLSCNLESKNKCGSCNSGYKLMKNGTCQKIENSFIANYNVSSTTKPIYIMNLKGNNINFSNIDMYINDIKVFPYIIYDDPYKIYEKNCFVSYKFSKLGINTVKIIINQTLSKMQELFHLCSDLVNIVFSDTFDTSKVQCMDYLFGSCSSLTSFNVSSFNTSLVMSYTYMFDGCDKLTSIDLSNFGGKYTCGFDSMFMSLKNLKYIDISSLYSIDPEENYLNLLNVPKDGTIIANKQLKGISSYNWKIIYKS